MKKTLACAAVLALVAPVVVPPPAAASSFAWTFGTAFRIGGAQFHISMRDGYYGAPVYYYRTPYRVRGHGRVCHGACYRGGGHYFHHPYCPVAEAYFHSYGFSSYDLFARYAPISPGYHRHGRRWGPYFAPGHHGGFQAHLNYWAPPVYFDVYGYGNPDRGGARYERWDRRKHNPNSKGKGKHKHRHHH